MKRLIAGNWKMHGLKASLAEVEALAGHVTDADADANDILICPPATLIGAFATAVGTGPIRIGAQTCHTAETGAHTGDISAEMLVDAGATAVIVGHSERRQDHHETDQLVKAQAEAALRAGLLPIICVGETRTEREAGKAIEIVSQQISGSLPEAGGDYAIAYEPVWAIGTGLTPTLEDIAEVHDHLRTLTDANIRLLYGGSVKPGNAAEILSVSNVNGALVGGASLKAEDFYGIISA